ncbi:MAG TPA: hypothetical protein VFV68_09000 [Agriterribacter sp.]|nr:hypothetical protein [Agriterribacter sp.]
MIDLFTRVWENLLQRTEGPMHFRFIMQPAMSLIFAITAAIRDAKAGTVPYLWRFAYSKGQRKSIAKEAWTDVGKIFVVGAVLDVIYQLVVIFGTKTEAMFYPLESVIVAFALAIVPYIILRGPVSRIVRIFIKKKEVTDTNADIDNQTKV